jgi:DNA-binding FadR family transcriptional regulator
MKKSIALGVAPVGTERAYQAVARSITNKILQGEWPIGSPLPGEFALADAFGVHRSTIRESIRLLEQEGLLSRPRGTKQLVVNAPSGAHVASRMTAAIVLQEITFLELWETMMALEPAAAQAAAMNATAEELAALHANVDETRLVLDDSERLFQMDMEFLDGVAAASHNGALQLCRAPLGSLLYPAFLPVLQTAGAGQRLVVAHEHILSALEVRDAPRAREWMAKHVADFRRGYERAGLDITKPVIWPLTSRHR